MKTLPITATEEQVKQWVREWIALLGEQRYEEAISWLHPNVSRYGQFDHWTAKRLQAIINNYGIEKPIPEDTWVYQPIPVTEELREDFERNFSVGLPDSDDSDDYWGRDNMNIHVDLPLLHESGEFISDVTARMILRRVSENEIGVELFDAHVM